MTVEHCRKTVFTNMLHNIFNCSIFAVSGKQKAKQGSDSDDTDAVCMKGVIYSR